MNEFNECTGWECVCTQQDLQPVSDPWSVATKVLFWVLVLLLFAAMSGAALA
jgi:hypothetical protein